MATQVSETVPMLLTDPVEEEINNTIDRLIFSLNQRRLYLIATLRDKREELRANRVARQLMEQQLVESRSLLEDKLTDNRFKTMHERIANELETKLAELQLNIPNEVDFKCDTYELEEHIARLGEIIHIEMPPVPPRKAKIPNYSAFQQPIVAVGKYGQNPGDIIEAEAVSIEKESGNIYVVDQVNKMIKIFSETREYLNQFRDNILGSPYGLLIHQDNIYVTNRGGQALFLFKLPDITLIKRVGRTGGSGMEEFNDPRQLAISPNDHIYVADQGNDRLQILTISLAFQGSLRHQTMTAPVDVKFTVNEMFVLSCRDNPCMHVFTLSGEKLRSLVTCGIGMEVLVGYFFCLDAQNNIVISDYSDNNIKVFSQAGELLHMIGSRGQHARMFWNPTGVTILNNNKLVCVSKAKNSGLKIFSA